MNKMQTSCVWMPLPTLPFLATSNTMGYYKRAEEGNTMYPNARTHKLAESIHNHHIPCLQKVRQTQNTHCETFWQKESGQHLGTSPSVYDILLSISLHQHLINLQKTETLSVHPFCLHISTFYAIIGCLVCILWLNHFCVQWLFIVGC